MVGVEGEGGGERADVGDEGDVGERRRSGQEGEPGHLAVGGGLPGALACRAAGGLLSRPVLLLAKAHHLGGREGSARGQLDG